MYRSMLIESTGAPERIIIYHGGTGRTLIIGLMRITSILIFGVSTFILAPSFVDDEHPWFIGPAGKVADTSGE